MTSYDLTFVSIFVPPAATSRPPAVDQFKSRVELRIECNNLLNKDVMSKSDPCAAIYIMTAGSWHEVCI